MIHIRFKSTKILSIVICLLCTFNPVFAEDIDTSTESASSTTQVLRETYGANEVYITKFMRIAERLTITLDPLLLGLELSTTPYSVEDREQIVKTLTILIDQQFGKAKSTVSKSYTASAGAPGAGKTFALEKMHSIDVTHGKFPKDAIYIGPDSVVLPQMQVYLKNCVDPQFGPLKSYEKWRAASNYIANFMMVKAMTDGLNIVHDTTSTNAKTKTILDVLGQEGYEKRLHFFVADKVARENALIHRKKKLGYIVELKANPTTSKAEAAFERLVDGTYIDRVDIMVFYAQKSDFYLGRGETIAFAKYNPKESKNIQILTNMRPFVDHMLRQVDEQENLKPELQAAVHNTIATWICI